MLWGNVRLDTSYRRDRCNPSGLRSAVQAVEKPSTTRGQIVELPKVVADIAEELVALDASGVPFRAFRPGVGPYGEPQLIREIARRLNAKGEYKGKVVTTRSPDLLIKGNWGIEFKIARPFGDNAKQAENWSVNLLHPYSGNVSLIGDCLRLRDLPMEERKAVAVIGYEHTPPQIELGPLVRSFELLVTHVAGIRLGPRIEITRKGLIHPVHQQLTIFAWELLESDDERTVGNVRRDHLLSKENRVHE